MDSSVSMTFDHQTPNNEDGNNSDKEDRDEFQAAVELDESLLNFPATGVDSIVTNSTQFYSRVKPKKAFSLMKFKKRLHKDTSLLFDEQPQ